MDADRFVSADGATSVERDAVRGEDWRYVFTAGPFRTEFAGRSRIANATQFADYEPTVGKRIEASTATSGKQAGDPVRGVSAIIEAVETGAPFQRLLLGKIAYDQAMAKVESLRQNFSALKELTLSADFPEA